MADLFENPMGLMGFEFVEFASPTPNTLEPLFEKLGFTLVAKHRSKNVVLYRQGHINFVVNREPRSAATYFAAEHGACACGLAFRVKDAHQAYARALELGAQPLEMPTGPMELRLPAIKGIGGAPLYLIDRFEDGKSIYDIDFEFVEGVDRHPVGHDTDLCAFTQIHGQPARAKDSPGGIVALGRVAPVAFGPQFAHDMLAGSALGARVCDVAALSGGGTHGKVPTHERRHHEAVAALREHELAFEEFTRLGAPMRPGGRDLQSAVRRVDDRPKRNLADRRQVDES